MQLVVNQSGGAHRIVVDLPSTAELGGAVTEEAEKATAAAFFGCVSSSSKVDERCSRSISFLIRICFNCSSLPMLTPSVEKAIMHVRKKKTMLVLFAGYFFEEKYALESLQYLLWLFPLMNFYV